MMFDATNVVELKTIKNDEDASKLGYRCIGVIESVYPAMPLYMLTNWYRTWIWENDKGERIATWDEGNSWCHYMCDGSEDKLTEYLQDLIDNPRD